MKDGFLKIGVSTPPSKVADTEYNVKELVRIANDAAKEGVKVLLFPELSITGASAGDLFLSSRLVRSAEDALFYYIDKTSELDVVSFVGLPVLYFDKLYNAVAAVHKGRLLGVVPKEAVTSLRYFAPAPEENSYITLAGFDTVFGKYVMFESEGAPSVRIALDVGCDSYLPIPPSAYHVLAGASLILNPSADAEIIGKEEARVLNVRSLSARYSSAYALASAGSGESGTDMLFSSHNLIAEMGNVLAESKPISDTELSVATIDVERISLERRRGAFVSDPTGYEIVDFALDDCVCDPINPPKRFPFVPEDPSEISSRAEKILAIQSKALAERIVRAHAKTAVLGISGGLDSTLALLVMAKAMDILGRDRKCITAVTMPCFGTTERTRTNAEELSLALGANLKVVDIKRAVSVHFEDIGHDPECFDVVYENAQARERTQILMDIANAEGGMVIGTGDLSELALGWATYNGDHMSMYGVNASVPKTLIRHVVEYSAKELGGECEKILRDVLNTPVSPELLPPKDGEIAQCTEGIVGPYELHDYFLYHTVRSGFSPDKIYRLAKLTFKGVYEDEVILSWLKIFVRRFFTQQFKRSALPDGPKVGSVSLSPRGDFCMPSDASFGEWEKTLE